MNARPILVNQKDAAAMLGMSVKSFLKEGSEDHRLMPAVTPKVGMKLYLVSDLEAWAQAVKYPGQQEQETGGMWGDESAA
ncbi:MAG: hypothetical protein JJ902_03815 [Roseibium sp.]|nr:hypothetical protein [Roseibium sp.]